MKSTTVAYVGFRYNFLRYYYLATPLFFLADVLWKFNFRIPFLNHFPTLKYTYYTVAFLCGVVVSRYPASTAWVGLIESGCNVGIAVIAFMSVIYGLSAQVASGQYFSNPITIQVVLNFMTSCSVFLISFYSNQAAIDKRLPLQP